MKISTIILFSAITLSSCSVMESYDPQSPSSALPSDRQVDVVFNIDGLAPASKSTGSIADSTVSSVNIFVFDSKGDINAYAKVTTKTAQLKATMGTLDCYAVANVNDDLSGIKTKAALLGRISLLEKNQPSSLHMIGSSQKTVSKTDNVVNISLKRFASMVEIDEIGIDESLQALGECKLEAIYLINVPGALKYDFSQPAEGMVWFNKGVLDATCTASSLIYDKFTSKTLTTSSPMKEKHVFFTYPNPTTTDAYGGTWSARHTRLVVEISLNSHKYYYPVDIVGANGKIEENHKYTITKMIITGPGADTPDEVLSRDKVDISLSVENWLDAMSTEVTY